MKLLYFSHKSLILFSFILVTSFSSSNAQNRVLSIHGDGILGLIPALILEKIEKTTGKPIVEQFDLIVGDGIGGFIAACLASGYSTSEVVAFFKTSSEKFFPHQKLGKINAGLGKGKYNTKKYESWLEELFINKKISDTDIPIAITAYDHDKQQQYVFSTFEARESKKNDFSLNEIVQATTTKKGLYKTFQLKDSDDYTYSFKDSMSMGRDPALEAISLANKMFSKSGGFLVVNIDSGTRSEYDSTTKLEDGLSAANLSRSKSNYFSFQSTLRNKINPDDTDSRSLSSLQYTAEDTLSNNRDTFIDLIDALKTRHVTNMEASEDDQS